MSKLAPSATVEAQLKAFDLCSGHIECEQPNAATNKFAGNLHLSSSDAEAQRLIDRMGSVAPITIANVLMRGSSVRNTECVLGLVINTGFDTKVRPTCLYRTYGPLTYLLVPHLRPSHHRAYP